MPLDAARKLKESSEADFLSMLATDGPPVLAVFFARWSKPARTMLPVLEDSTLAERSFVTLTVKDLLLFSAVCGTGLDTVPLPGNVTAGQIEALLLDVAFLAVRLNKPLTARLMPVPGKNPGEMTAFDFSYFSNGRVLALDADAPVGVMTGNEVIDIKPRNR